MKTVKDAEILELIVRVSQRPVAENMVQITCQRRLDLLRIDPSVVRLLLRFAVILATMPALVQYHQSYELSLRNIGMESFRRFLSGQDVSDQGEVERGGPDVNLSFTMGAAWAILLSDVVQDLEYRTRPYEVIPGQTAQVSKEAIEHLYHVFRSRPVRNGKWRLAREATGEDHGRVLSADGGGRPELPHSALAGDGAEVAARMPWIAGVIRLASYECGMDQPTYTPVQQIIERSGTLFFSFQELDSTKPSGSVKIRVETISHYLQKYAHVIIDRKVAAGRPDCPLLPQQ